MPGREESLSETEPAASVRERAHPPVLRRVLERFAATVAPASVRHADTAMQPAQVHSPDGLWDFGTLVRDDRESGLLHLASPRVSEGLGGLAPDVSPAQPESASPLPTLTVSDNRIRTLVLLAPPAVRSPRLPEQRPLRVRAHGLLHETSVGSPRWSHPGTDLRCRSVPMVELARIADGGAWNPISPAAARIKDGTPRARKEAHTRVSVPPTDIPAEDAALFTSEAERLRRIAPGKAELVGVFRRVPVEVISRVRLSGDCTKLTFEAAIGGRRTRTRVHDLAAVRNAESTEVHLVPHRNRYATAQLDGGEVQR